MARTTFAVAAALEAARVDHVIIKGATLSVWLYAPGERRFVDTDVLVPLGELSTARDVLARLGWVAVLGDAAPTEQDGHSLTLTRADTGVGRFGAVDLHFSLPGAAIGRDLWPDLAAHRVRLRIGNREIWALDMEGRALTVCLHVARDGRANVQAQRDLERCLAVLPRASWWRVADLAERLGATAALVRGLELAPDGAAIARELGIAGRTSREMELRRRDAPALAYGLERLAGVPRSQRLHTVLRELWPTESFLRHWGRLTGQPEHLRLGRLRLRRVTYLASGLPAAWLTWRRSRRDSRPPEGDG